VAADRDRRGQAAQQRLGTNSSPLMRVTVVPAAPKVDRRRPISCSALSPAWWP
jgi:hypothetical protein